MSRWKCDNCKKILDNRCSNYPHCNYCNSDVGGDPEWVTQSSDEGEIEYLQQLLDEKHQAVLQLIEQNKELKIRNKLLTVDKKLLIDFINHLDDVVVDGEHYEYYKEWVNEP